MGLWKDLKDTPGTLVALVFGRRRTKKRKPMFSVQVSLDEDTKKHLKDAMEKVGQLSKTVSVIVDELGDTAKHAIEYAYSDLKASGRLDKLAEKISEILAKAGAAIEINDKKTIEVRTYENGEEGGNAEGEAPHRGTKRKGHANSAGCRTTTGKDGEPT